MLSRVGVSICNGETKREERGCAASGNDEKGGREAPKARREERAKVLAGCPERSFGAEIEKHDNGKLNDEVQFSKWIHSWMDGY